MIGDGSDRFPEMPAELREDKRRARRYSTGSTISRYLGPLPGSCHDFCKYGNGKKEAQPDIRSVISHARRKMKLSGGRGSEEQITLIGIIKEEHKANKINSATETRKKAKSRQPKSTMPRILPSSRGAMKPKGTNTLPRVPSENHGLPAKVKPIVRNGTRKSTGCSIHSLAPPEARKMTKEERSKGDNRAEVQGEELYSNDGKVENEALESTNYYSIPSFPEPQENGSSNSFYDFAELDEVNATGKEDEAKVNQEACKAEKLYFKREKANGLKPLIHSPRRLKFRRPSNEDCGYLSDPGCMKVDLRHCQLQEKEATRLLNDIIEETAAELNRTQKSKVKALVGAFETVISLQDVDPSSNI